MPISYVGDTLTTGANPTLTIPSGVQAGDLLIARGLNTATAISVPSGWTSIANGSAASWVFYKFASASEPPLSITGGSSAAQSVMQAYRGVGAVGATAANSSFVSSTTISTPTVTTPLANCWVLSHFNSGAATSSTATAPASTTQRVNASGGGTLQTICLVDEVQAAAGTSTARTVTFSPAVSSSGARAIVLMPNDDFTPVALGISAVKASTTQSATTNLAVPAGSSIFVTFLTTSNTAPSVSDGANTYVQVSAQAAPGSATGFHYVYAAYNISAMLPTGSGIAITVGASSGYYASAWMVIPSTLTSSSFVSVTSTSGSSTAPTATATGLTAANNYLAFGVIAINGPNGDTFTQATGWAQPPTNIGSTGAGATSNWSVRGGYDLVTGVTSLTYAPTLGTSRAWAEMLLLYMLGNVYSVTLTETATVTDSTNRTFAPGGSLTETATATDASATQLVAVAAQAETATATDTVASGGSVTANSVAETATATDTTTAGKLLTAAAAETATATETVAQTTAFNRAVTEAATATESVANQLTATAALTETAAQTDAVSAAGSVYGVARTEAVTATDVVATTGLSYGVNVSETATALATQTSSGAFFVALSESVSPQDFSSVQSTFFAAVLEIASVSDVVAARLLWELIDDLQNANWQNPNTAQAAGWAALVTEQGAGWQNPENDQAPGWAAINTSQNPGWTPI